ncbi:MAG: hypothetical protein IT361_10780 [Gemmatimonadaceae bacterium]|nr:hypothetical protein [Gemmatimonadaceae bacterium]
MRLALRRSWWLMAVAGIACERQAPARSNDTTSLTTPPPDSVVTVIDVPAAAWDSAAGPIFLVIGANPQQAAVIVPGLDTTASLDTVDFKVDAYRAMPVELFANGRRLGTASLGPAISIDVPEDCSAWPVVGLTGTDTSTWTVAFRTDRFQPLTIDSLPELTRADSLKQVMELARVASAAPGDTVEALKGLPFVVKRAYSTRLPNGIPMVIAEVSRALNQEANPIQEHLLLIAERDTTRARDLRLAYLERSAGGEETLESSELLLAGVPRGRTEPVVLLARYVGDGVVYALLERQPEGRWRLRWSSPYAGC